MLYNVPAHAAQRVILHQRLWQTLMSINFPDFGCKRKRLGTSVSIPVLRKHDPRKMLYILFP